MNDQPVHFVNEYHGQTTLHPIGLAALAILILATLALPRRLALLPMLVLVCFIPSAQRIVILGADFSFARLMIVAGWARIVMLREYIAFRWNRLDTMVSLFIGANVVLGTRSDGANLAALVNYLGQLLDVAGGYFLFRCLIHSWEDVVTLGRGAIVLSVPVLAAFVYEHFTARNVFSIFGGVPEVTNLRSGRLRCQGAFSHPILAGCFWASLMPLMAWQWWNRWRIGAVVGCIAAAGIVVMCASSTPVMAVLAGMFAAGLFFLRSRMRWIVAGGVAALIGLHIVMTAPVWHLLARMSIVGGSTGRHRYRLVDAFIRHVDEWFLAGSSLGTDHWGRGLFDVTNYYIIQGLRGGIVLLLLFMAMLWVGFKLAGVVWRRDASNRAMVIGGWAMGVALFQHAVNFIGVAYFGQIIVLFYLQLAIIGSLAVAAQQRQRRILLVVEEEESELDRAMSGGMVPALAGHRQTAGRQ